MSVPQRTAKSILEIAAEVLVRDATASLAQVAAAAGIGRTTLHKRYPTRQHLLVAVAEESLDILDRAVTEAIGDDPGESLRDLVDALVPLGPRLEFLLRQPSLDAEPELQARWVQVDRPLTEFMGRVAEAGLLRPGVAPWWAVSSLYAVAYTAWEGVALGKLAPLDAAGLAYGTLMGGIGR
ncbi:TetR/AcrR family transcriptional regulator [Actinokineospora diospyrosa]|uniref:Transcriptional regulator, TetR family n=1 Tax=Actinokineospora diospyrosa TaxID=103728 RepID=A0ABT1IHP9_9PSEU|nr:TetR/AcrR family transcriptional regulator [Actinokineospora diospyrosa]MCP2272167.1 transcriptional regulator, TetR family [Actinokineospora diospyrosa]